MSSLKFGVVVCGLLGLIGSFLPLTNDVTFFETRLFDAANVYIILGGYATALAMGALGVAKGMERWMALVAIVGFAMIVLRMRTEMIDLLKAGMGAKLMGIGALAGLVFAVLATARPEPARQGA
jgi:hypothetical protein